MIDVIMGYLKGFIEWFNNNDAFANISGFLSLGITVASVVVYFKKFAKLIYDPQKAKLEEQIDRNTKVMTVLTDVVATCFGDSNLPVETRKYALAQLGTLDLEITPQKTEIEDKPVLNPNTIDAIVDTGQELYERFRNKRRG